MAVDANGNPIEDKKVEFSAEQQAKVNDLLKDAMGRAGKEARDKAVTLEADVTSAKAQLAQAQADLAAARTAGDKKEAKGEVAQLQAAIDEMKRAQQGHLDEKNTLTKRLQDKDAEVTQARQEALNVRKTVAISKAASQINFVNNEVVAKLTESNIQWDADKNRFVVLADNGTQRVNSSYEPMTLEEYYTEFASQNPYLVRGDVKGGTGSSGSRNDVTRNGKYEVTQIFGSKSNSKLATQLMKENPNEYHRLKAIAIENDVLAG